MTGGTNSAAMDKYLKKIYDSLNMGCNKKAVQEVDKLPDKVRDSPLFKALKALALIRLYKRRQAFDLLSGIDPEDDLCEVTLSTIASCYKESADASRIIDYYEAAVKRRPNDHDIVAHLFMAHVRVFNFKRQKEIAMQMYKNFPKKKRLYTFWAIMSLVMQSREAGKLGGQDSVDKKVCLSLAEKMCEKMIDEERSYEEIELYLMILRKQNKYEEEYRFLTGPICSRMNDHLSWFNRRRAYLCLDLKMYSRAFKHYFPTLIQEYPDQIEYYQGLFKSAFLIDTEALSQQQSMSDQQSQGATQATGTPVKSSFALAECYDLVEKQCTLAIESTEAVKEKQKSKSLSKSLSRALSLNANRRHLLRGPFIARIELFHTILTNENTLPQNVFNLCKNQFAKRFPSMDSILLDYFQLFSKKIICYYDMEYMIKKFELSQGDKERLVESIELWLHDIKKNSDYNAFESFHIVLNYQMLKHSLNHYKFSDSREQRIILAKQFIDLYDENRHIGKNSNKTEFLPVDHYCLLVINSIMTNSISLDGQFMLSDSVIITLITITENAVANSPSNHQLKLVLLKLYSLIGASKLCSEVLLSIDINNFQVDTLGHLLNPVLYNTGNYSLSKESLDTCLEFYAHGVRECFDGLTTSYRDGRFSKIEEIGNVLIRLSDSLNATQCVLLKGIVANVCATNFDEINTACLSLDPFKGLNRIFRCNDSFDGIKDNRDFRVLKSLNMDTNQLVQERQQQTLNDEQIWLKLRYFLLRSVYIQFELFKSDNCNSCGDKLNPEDELKLGQSVVEELMPKVQSAIDSSSNITYSYLEPESTPFRWSYIDFKSLVSLVTPTVFLPKASLLDSKIQETYYTNLDALVNNLEKQISSTGSMMQIKQVLSSFTITIEFISLAVTSLLSLSQSQLLSTSGNQLTGAGNKATNQQPQAPQAKQKSISQQMINKTEAQLIKISNMLKSLDIKSLVLDKVGELEEGLQSSPNQERIDTKSGSHLVPLMAAEAQQAALVRIKGRILESYSESIKEIEAACRGKVKLFRSRDSWAKFSLTQRW